MANQQAQIQLPDVKQAQQMRAEVFGDFFFRTLGARGYSPSSEDEARALYDFGVELKQAAARRPKQASRLQADLQAARRDLGTADPAYDLDHAAKQAGLYVADTVPAYLAAVAIMADREAAAQRRA